MDMKEILKPSAILICSAVTDRIVGYVLLSYTRQEACMRVSKVLTDIYNFLIDSCAS